MKKQKYEVVQSEAEEKLPIKIIAQSIKRMADAYRNMKNAGLSQRAILVLLKDASGESQHSIKNVLDGLDDLEKMYLSK